MTRRVYLIGPRGSGKSTVGRLLASRLGWRFVDADVELEARAGVTVRELFAAAGEPAFRDRESAVLADLAGLDGHVIATGGGVVLRPANRALLAAPGSRVVWLTADADTLWRRTQADPSSAERRPALYGGGVEEVRRVLAEREPLYRACAGVVIDVAGLSPEDAVGRIVSAWTS